MPFGETMPARDESPSRREIELLFANLADRLSNTLTLLSRVQDEAKAHTTASRELQTEMVVLKANLQRIGDVYRDLYGNGGGQSLMAKMNNAENEIKSLKEMIENMGALASKKSLAIYSAGWSLVVALAVIIISRALGW